MAVCHYSLYDFFSTSLISQEDFDHIHFYIPHNLLDYKWNVWFSVAKTNFGYSDRHRVRLGKQLWRNNSRFKSVEYSGIFCTVTFTITFRLLRRLYSISPPVLQTFSGDMGGSWIEEEKVLPCTTIRTLFRNGCCPCQCHSTCCHFKSTCIEQI